MMSDHLVRAREQLRPIARPRTEESCSKEAGRKSGATPVKDPCTTLALVQEAPIVLSPLNTVIRIRRAGRKVRLAPSGPV
jgi:hypothetical protein